MNHKLTNNTIRKKPIIVELIGPAGAGKTTILRALSQHNKKIKSDFHPSKISQFPFFVHNTLILLPTYLRQYRNSRWFNWRESRSMAYLKAGLRVLGQQASNNDMVTILDHGPIYRLAFLRALGPEITTSQQYENWWVSLLTQWTDTIDIIVWLDAPNAILLERIDARNRWHSIKETSEQEAYEFLNQYRTFLEQTIAESMTDGELSLLSFDTNQESVEQIVGKILATIDVVSNAG